MSVGFIVTWGRYQWVFGHVMGWAKPSVFLSDNRTLAFTRVLAQLKVKHKAHLVFGRLMRPPTLAGPDGTALNETSWCQQTVCCHAPLVLGQLWMDPRSGLLGLALANPANSTIGTSHMVAPPNRQKEAPPN
jgi:hypothetical protein